MLAADRRANAAEIGELVAASRTAFRALACLVTLAMFLVGLALLALLALPHAGRGHVAMSWAVVCVGYGVMTWQGPWHCLLSGLGWKGRDTLIQSIAVVAVTAAQCACVATTHGDLLALAVVTTAGAIAPRLALSRALGAEDAALMRGRATRGSHPLRALAPLALRNWLTALGAFLILKTDQYFIAARIGVAQVPQYAATQQLFMTSYGGGLLPSSAASPFVSTLWASGERARVHQLFQRCMVDGLTLMAAAVCVLLLCGPELIARWIGQPFALPAAVLAIFAITWVLELNHVAIATFSRATDHEDYAPVALIAGGLNLCLCLLLIGRLGVVGVALATCLAQLATNNWYVVAHGLRRLGYPFRTFLWRVAAPVAAGAGACLGAGAALSPASGPLRIAIGLGLPCAAFLAINLALKRRLARRVREGA